jgi:hypothetical protein
MSRKPRRFDSSVLPITSAVAGALLVAGCGSGGDRADTDVAVCRDARGMRTLDSNCGGAGRSGAGAGWHYYGSGERVPAVGEAVAGGSSSPRAGVSYARASSATVTRGGFGSSAHSGGGGE